VGRKALVQEQGGGRCVLSKDGRNGALENHKKVGENKNRGAIIVELTQKANDILRAWDEHLASHI
jgi:hypothetical protein